MERKNISKYFSVVLLIPLFMATLFFYGQGIGHAAQGPNVIVEVIEDNDTLFSGGIKDTWIAFGDVTNDGEKDLVVTKGYFPSATAAAAVFQQTAEGWDHGTLISGPTLHHPSRPIIAPIRNDGNNWLVYSEHRTGNTGEWLRSHRYDGTTLVENYTITPRTGWKGWFAPSAADLDADGDLEIWFVELYGAFPRPNNHLKRAEWNPTTNTFQIVEILDGGYYGQPVRRPNVGDFDANGTQTLAWMASRFKFDIVRYTPGSGVHDHTSSTIFTPPDGEYILSHAAGNIDGAPGTDIVISTSGGASTMFYIISGNTFNTTVIDTGTSEMLEPIVLADLDNSGLDEIYAAGRDGGVYAYDEVNGWRLVEEHTGVWWFDGTLATWSDKPDEVYFVGTVNSSRFRLVKLSHLNSPPIAEAGGPYDVDEGSSITLPGSGSDPDDDPLTYAWDLENDGVFETPGQEIVFSAVGKDGPDQQTVALEVCDDKGACDSDSAEVAILNVPPVADAGPDASVNRYDTVEVRGSWVDPAGILDEPYYWTWDLDGDGLIDSVGYAPDGDMIHENSGFDLEGFYTLTFSVTDDDGGLGTDTVIVEVLNQPPVCQDASPSLDNLWPPNHEFVPIEILGVTDPEGDEITLTIVSIFQDEVVDDGGDGEFEPDAYGLGTGIVEVRAERSGSDDGRVYHIVFRVDDGHGGVCTNEVLVGVPLSQGKNGTPIDGGALFDSTIILSE